jgi:eukaryotic-like serine/threonine-protein kinase
MGTVAYMSPEQALGKDVDSRSDLFSLGVVLYEMATGRQAFPGSTTAAIYDGILNRAPAPPVRLNPELPAKLEEIINKLLEKDRDLRYQGASELRADLKRLKRDTTSGRGLAAPAMAAAESVPDARATARLRRSWSRLAAIAGGAIVVIAAILGYVFTRPGPPPRVLGTLQLTNTGRQKSGVVTDGTRLYFFDSQLGLAQVSVAGGETVAIPNSLPNLGFTFLDDVSPDGSELLLATSKGTTFEGELWTLPVLGGSARRLGNFSSRSTAWSPDGKRIAYTTGEDVDLANSDGSNPHRILTAAGTTEDIHWSPDGKKLSFTVNDPRTNNRSIWQASSDGSNLHPLLPGWSRSPNECCGTWTPDGRYFIFQAASGGPASVWALRVGGGLFGSGGSKPVQLTTGPMDTGGPVPGRDGKTIFITGWQPRAELVRYDEKSRQFLPYLGGISASYLAFSRDGQWVAYNDASDGTLWRSKLDGTEKIQLVSPPMQAYLPRWSPDGSRIAFFGHPPGQLWKIYAVPAAGGSPELLYGSDKNVADPNWSPDAQSLVFGGVAGANQGSAIFVLDLKTRKAAKLPGSDGLFSPRWSPTGRYIAALPLDSMKLMLFDFTTRKWTELAGMYVGYPTWSRDGSYVYYDGVLDNQEGYFRIRVPDGKPERIVSLAGFQPAGGAFGIWSGLSPDDSPLFVRDASIQEIYALSVDLP